VQKNRYEEVSRSTVDGRLVLLRLLDSERKEIVEVSRDAVGRCVVCRGSENGGQPRALNKDDLRQFGKLLPDGMQVSDGMQVPDGRGGFGEWILGCLRKLGVRIV